MSRHYTHLPVRGRTSYDNGPENVEHTLLNQALGAQSYFCELFHTWAKGSVEPAIGLIRCLLSKKTDFAIIILEKFKQIADLVNNRPHEVLSERGALTT